MRRECKKAYRFNAVYNDILLCEFLISETSDFNFLAQNLCESINAVCNKDSVCVYTKKKRHSWDEDTRLFLDGLNKPLNAIIMRTGKKILVEFGKKASEGIEIQYMAKSQINKPSSSKKPKTASNQFEIVTLHKFLNKRQMSKLGLVQADVNVEKTTISETSKKKPGVKTSQKKPRRDVKAKNIEKASELDSKEAKIPAIIETVESKMSINRSFDEDFIDNLQDKEAEFDFDEETTQDFDSNDVVDEEDDDEAPDDFTADTSDDDDENLEETLDDIENDEYSYDDNAYDDDDLYPDDDEDFMENYDKIDDEEEFFQRDDYELYYDDEQDDDDDDKY